MMQVDNWHITLNIFEAVFLLMFGYMVRVFDEKFESKED